ncbi:M10 family metallopeptidase C-terminal domain-containing protein [Qipengyuania sp. 6B39]|uniref:M10 family metallopeptidase C-terminal domain-containing protein n=1 Tax=Qipengyuania proteolytica TaxID=2867239 RepID=UPI001C8A8D40|nr:M10 family metallopeptidase C-terminal domain-containing protein [Qipengyuania proteolytica]MBX7496424.1 M10 family metallopeptidase C-terminal domain-containing protein [Qipengyuania proteolytica]
MFHRAPALENYRAFEDYGTMSLAAPFGLTAIDVRDFDFGHETACACGCCAAKDDTSAPQRSASLATNANGVDIPGDTSTTATIAVGGSVTDELEVAGDTDWFRITLQAGDTIDISLFGSGASPVSDTYLRVYDSNGNLLADNDDGGSGYNSYLRFTSGSGGTFYIEADSFGNNKTGEYTIEVTESAPLTVYSYDEIALQLTNGYWGGSQRSWNVGTDGQLTYDVSAMPADAQYLAEQALLLWGDVTGIEFVSVVGSAEITFQDTESGAYASSSTSGGVIVSSTVNISADWLANYGPSLNSYSFQTYLHEIGHALGLGHAGNYNGSADYPVDALYLNDSWATTVMSYFSQTENTYFSGQGFTRAFVTTPMNGDIVAIGNLYGLSTTTRLGNTTYGFNSNAGRDIYDATIVPDAAYTIVDSGGTDTLDYSGYSQSQTINLNEEAFSSVGGEVGNVVIARGTVIENAIGGSGADTIYGNDGQNTIDGGAGDDLIFGGNGGDFLIGGAGNDQIEGGGGWDWLRGRDGNDILRGGSGNDWIAGEDGNDILEGGADNDIIDGGLGEDTLRGGDGDDRLSGGGNSDLIYGDAGNDILDGSYGWDWLRGGEGDDKLYGANGNDWLLGDEGADELFGDSGNDRLQGGTGEDLLYGGDGDDTVFGEGNSDIVYGGNGNDSLDGAAGWDRLYGEAGNDALNGGNGVDFLAGGAGQDTLTGGSGSDIFYFDLAGASNADNLTDFVSGADIIRLDLAGAFSRLAGTGSLAASAFRIGTAAADADDRIIYDQATGNVWYDADGNGIQAAQLFAKLTAGALLAAGDFQVINSSVAAAPLADSKDLLSTTDTFAML